jgi:hypothetical protein
LVRCGQRGAVGTTFDKVRSTEYGGGQEREGAAASGDEPHSATGMVEQQTPPKHDILAVFSPKEGKSAVYVGGGKIINAKPLWVLNEEGVLRSTVVPGMKQLRHDIETAEAGQAKR